MRLAILATVLVASALSGCGGSATSPTMGSTLTVMLTDSPFSDAKAVLVTFSEVSAHRSGGDLMPLPFTGGSTRTCDLKKLTTAQDILGAGPLPVGHYTELRLIVARAAIYFDAATAGAACGPTLPAPTGRMSSVTIPSGEVRLNREFDVTAANVTTILLDFDGDRSINQTGNGQYMMAPVIAVVSVQ